jgi:hypothetical protein
MLVSSRSVSPDTRFLASRTVEEEEPSSHQREPAGNPTNDQKSSFNHAAILSLSASFETNE